MSQPFAVRTEQIDLPALVGAFTRRLHESGLAVGPERAARLARALELSAPIARRRLYWVMRAVLVADPAQVRAFDAVFAQVFGSGAAASETPVLDAARLEPVRDPDDSRAATEPPAGLPPLHRAEGTNTAAPAPRRPGPRERAGPEQLVPALASGEEVIRSKRFDAMDATELATVYRLMAGLALATPMRRTRRAKRHRRGEAVDLRRTVRASLRTGGDPVRLARRRRRVLPRRLVLLCDISGSMEPYARAYLQFLTCATGGGDRRRRSEAFAFATRLTRLTRALASRSPDRAIHQAAAAAPDWSSGTRIGEALRSFNDRHGRRGIARGAVVVILSDGWERGDPALVGREMERLSRLAHRIVWVNPRAGSAQFQPHVGGMAAALPYCDALVAGHTLEAMETVIDAIASERARRPLPIARAPATAEATAPEPEPWASATPVPGSSVAMPSGYGPSRGRTTPGWGTRG